MQGQQIKHQYKEDKKYVLGTRSMVNKSRNIPKLKIQGNTLDYVFQYKYLGVTIDEILSFHAHLKNTIKIVAHNILLLSKINVI